jgi:4-amino-4-deoxy-L-arabinose transferase-like glycosyltransferase
LEIVTKHLHKITIIHILLLALFLRVAWLLYAKPIPVSDFAEYKLLASNLITHHQFGYPTPTAYRLPGYPIFLALFLLINTSNLWLGFINVLLSLLIVYFIFILANQLSRNLTIAICASFLAAIYPIYIFFSPILASEHLFTVLLYGGLILLLVDANGKKLYITRIIAGIIFGLAMLTRGEAIYYIPIIALLGILPNKKKGEDFDKKGISNRILSSCLLFIAWGFIIIPWYIRNQVVIGSGSGLGTSGGIMFYYGHHNENQAWTDLLSVNNLGSGEVNRSVNAFQKGLSYIYQTPIDLQFRDKFIEALRLYAPNGYPVIWSAALPWSGDGTLQEKYLPGKEIFKLLTITSYLFVGILALLSLFFFRHTPPRLLITILGFALMNLLGYAVLFAATSRYRYTIEGFLIILASSGIWQLNRFLIRQKEAKVIDIYQ